MALPYVHLLEDRDPIVVLRETPGRIFDLLKPMTPEAVESKPTPGKWSIREILCHLADCEIAWAWRLRMVYGAEDPTLQPFDQNRWAKAYHGAGYATATARAAWIGLRQWNLALIDALSEHERRRPAVHAELGPVTLWNIVEIAAGHDLHHLHALEQLAGVQQAG